MIHYGDNNSKNAMIFLHGYHQSACDARNKLKETINTNELTRYSMVIYFPNRSWFSYKNENSFEYDNDDLCKTRTYLHKMIQQMELKFKKIFLSGYSQGACTAIDAAFTYTKTIPILSISGFPLQDYMNKNNTIFATHGKRDKCIRLVDVRQKYKKYNNVLLVLSEADHWGFWHIKTFQLFFKDFIEKELIR